MLQLGSHFLLNESITAKNLMRTQGADFPWSSGFCWFSQGRTVSHYTPLSPQLLKKPRMVSGLWSQVSGLCCLWGRLSQHVHRCADSLHSSQPHPTCSSETTYSLLSHLLLLIPVWHGLTSATLMSLSIALCRPPECNHLRRVGLFLVLDAVNSYLFF